MGNLQKEWSLALHPSHLALGDPAADRPYIILRDQVMKTAMLLERMKTFVVEQPRKLMFKLTPEGTKTLAGWIGKPILAAFYLKRRYSWVLPIAIIWLLGAIPVGDILGIALGAVLLLGWVIAKYRPHSALFVLDGVWMLVLAGTLIKDVFVDGRSKGWLALVALLIWVGIGGFRYFVQFRGTTIRKP
jgi:hypothetical protein